MKRSTRIVAFLERGLRGGGAGPEGVPSAPRDPFEEIRDPWRWRTAFDDRFATSFCNICWWSGESFGGFAHSESAVCPACGSIARDRFLFYCFIERQPATKYRVLETSPRLGPAYRQAMKRWFEYRASDFDQRSHRADIAVDLQNIALADGSVDILLTPHVLEHVPGTDLALEEIRRILSVGGAMYLQVPVLQGATARPVEPEFHGDNTPVEWRFGPDLTARLREHGFDTRLLCTEGLSRHVEAGERTWPGETSPEFDATSMLESLCYDDFLVVSDSATAQRVGFVPPYMFLTWECRKLG